MSTYLATVVWSRQSTESFTDNKYSRAHLWSFDGGVTVPASSAPSSVPLPLSKPDAVDPEEAFVASLSSCHMLFFLYFAARGGFVVERYEDAAVGEAGKTEKGKLWVARVTLNPKVTWGGTKIPTAEEQASLHHRAHEDCYIANSVKSEVLVSPQT